MRAKAVFLGACFGLISQGALADIVRHSSVPSQFLGRWAASTDDCGKKSNSAIVLSSHRYAGGGKVCSVDWVDELPGADGPIYSAHLKCASPGDQSSNIVLRKKDANQISAGATFDALKILQRCPAN